MIQRKQSVFLFLAGVILFVTYFVPLATFIGESNSLVLNIYKVESMVPDTDTGLSPYFILPLLTTVSLIILFSFVTIFLYKKRRSQLLLVRFMLLLVLVYFSLYFFHYLEVLEGLTGGYANYQYGINIPGSTIQIPTIIFIIPLATALLLFMASRGIISDEKLLRSADRLR